VSGDLYVIVQEPGFGPTPIPTWTDKPGKIDLFEERSETTVSRVEIREVPGAFQLLDVLSAREADTIVEIAENLGFHQDAPVSLPHEVRHNDNMNWVVSESIDGVIWERSRHLVTETVGDQSARGINARFRFYRYGTGDYFSPHTDGAWPGSRVVDGELIADAYQGLYSQYSYLIFLNEGYEGGRTQFLVSKADPNKPAKDRNDVNIVSVSTPKGAVLCFPHGTHPQHCVHASEKITTGCKYIIRTDILFG
jgi:hypothetical protein